MQTVSGAGRIRILTHDDGDDDTTQYLPLGEPVRHRVVAGVRRVVVVMMTMLSQIYNSSRRADIHAARVDGLLRFHFHPQ